MSKKAWKINFVFQCLFIFFQLIYYSFLSLCFLGIFLRFSIISAVCILFRHLLLLLIFFSFLSLIMYDLLSIFFVSTILSEFIFSHINDVYIYNNEFFNFIMIKFFVLHLSKIDNFKIDMK